MIRKNIIVENSSQNSIFESERFACLNLDYFQVAPNKVWVCSKRTGVKKNYS